MDMAIHPGLRRRGRISPNETAIAMRQIHDEELGLLLDATDHHNCFAEIRLRVPRRVGCCRLAPEVCDG